MANLDQREARVGRRAHRTPSHSSRPWSVDRGVEKKLRDRHTQLQTRVRRLADKQKELEELGDHPEAEDALRERRYWEFIDRLLYPDTTNGRHRP